MAEKEQQFNDQIEELLEKAKATDEAELEELELDIPAEIQRREKRLATLRAAKERLEQRQREIDESHETLTVAHDAALHSNATLVFSRG